MPRSPTPGAASEAQLRRFWEGLPGAGAPALRTTDGRPVRVFSPGALNADEGPDFISAWTGSASPNKITFGFRMPPQALQVGRVCSSSKAALNTSAG